MSIGGRHPSVDVLYENAVKAARENNVLVVVAAGNDNFNHPSAGADYPCDFTQDNILCVGALDQKFEKANFSDYSTTHVDIFAPGTNMQSAYPGTFQKYLISPNDATGFATWSVSPTAAANGWGFGDCPVGGETYHLLQSPYTATNQWCNKGKSANAVDAKIWKSIDFSFVVNPTTLHVFGIGLFEHTNDGFLMYVQKTPGTLNFDIENVVGGKRGPMSDPKSFEITADISACKDKSCSIGFRHMTDNLTNVKDHSGIGIYAGIKSLSIQNNIYQLSDGTSMATPVVSGIAALVWAKNPDYTYKDVWNAVKEGAGYQSSLKNYATAGNNIANAYGALQYMPPTEGIVLVE